MMWPYFETGCNRVIDDFGNLLTLRNWDAIINRMTFILDGAPNV